MGGTVIEYPFFPHPVTKSTPVHSKSLNYMLRLVRSEIIQAVLYVNLWGAYSKLKLKLCLKGNPALKMTSFLNQTP